MSGTKKVGYAAVWLVLVAVIVGVAAIAVIQQRDKALEKKAPANLGAVPAFEVVNEKGTTVSLASLEGKIWVTDFIFSYCAGQCPTMTSKLRVLQEWLAKKEYDVKILSFSVDPDRDTTSILSEYSNRFKADPDRWDFLTGEKKVIYSLARQGLKLGVDDEVTTAEASEEEPIIHSNRFVLIDGAGQIRGYYNSEEPDALKQLRRDITTLVALDKKRKR